VTTLSGATQAPPRFRLQTFGTLRLVRAGDDTVLGGHGHQRRRLALLAVLAASPEGRSRDQLQALFWPEVPQERARHSLDQLLYALRTSLDAGVFTTGNPAYLNAAVIGSDVGDFSDALGRGELEAAIGLYRGPFLDGFYLSDAPEFEQWMEAERSRVERSYAEALERLARSLEDANDPAAVAPLLQKLIDIDPVSSKHATGLIRALMNAGDHAAALKYAERYEAIVARELGTGVGPAVTELVAEVRARSRTDAVVVRQEALPALSPSVARALESPARPAAARRLTFRYGIAALALAALLIAAARLRPRGAPPAPSIAVLPLANHSTDPRDAALADGMTEELIARLSQTTGLRVIASTSVFALQNRHFDVRRIADTLGVAQVLEGGLQKNGSRLRVQIRLLDPRDGSTRWSETYDRELRDVFAVEDDIARAVVGKLGLQLAPHITAPVRRQPTQSVAAYELYLHGNDKVLIRNDSTVRIGIELFRQAIALDSTYAEAWVGLARLYGRISAAAIVGTDRWRYDSLAETTVRKALLLDDSLPEAHATLASLQMKRHDFRSAEQELARAVALDPGNALTHEKLVSLLLWTGRPAEALAEAERGLELDPLAPEAHAELARALEGNNRCEEALAQLDKLAGLRPPLQRVTPLAEECYVRQRRWSDGIALVRARAERGEPNALAFEGFMLARSNQRPEAQRIRATLVERWRRGEIGALWVAVVSAGFDDHQDSCAWIERSITDRSLSPAPTGPALVVIGPLFEDVRRAPCFDRLRARLSLPKG
jgi:TolB-like protein/DNA-binding SARP family transcriptional activator